MPVEVRRGYHRQLEHIDHSLGLMLAAVVDGIPLATTALLDGDPVAKSRIDASEAAVDGLNREVEASAADIIACQAPHGQELRLLLSALRMAPELERAHDLVVHIAAGGGPPAIAGLTPWARDAFGQMGALAEEMWREVADCYAGRRPCPAGFAAQDQSMDGLRQVLLDEVAASSPDVAVGMRAALVARFYERLGDHAVCMARRVGYLAGERPPGRAAPPA